MSTKHVSLFANVSKSQIKENDTHFTIEGVPVTVDDAVMNGMHYPLEHNKKGMDTIKDKVITLSHPTDKKGLGADAYAGNSLQEFYSGGYIETVYAKGGVWYVNISIKKSMLKAQDKGKGFYERLSNKDDIGVSTGLYTDAKKESGTNAKGEKYTHVATEQDYNHLAMLESSEPPAGGQDTFMRFNGEGQGMAINLADYMIDSIPPDKVEVIDSEPKQADELNSLLAKLLAIIGIGKIAGNEENQHAKNAEDKAMKTTADKIKALKSKGKHKENMSDDEVSNAYDDMMKNEDSDKTKETADNSAVLSAINALTSTVTALNGKVEGLESQLNAKDTEQKETLVNKLKGLKTGLTENTLKTLSVNDLESMLLSQTGETVGLNGQMAPSVNTSVSDYSDSFQHEVSK